MKKNLPLLLAVLAAQSVATAAPIPISGTVTHTENFDSLGTASPAWTNDSTIPGWYAQANNGTTVITSAQATSGAADLSGLLNCGADGAADRALGSKSTSTGAWANMAIAVSFQNTGTTPVKLSTLNYTGEYWRSDTTANTAEHFVVFYQISSAPVTNIISGGSSATAAAGAGFTAMGAGANWTHANAVAATQLDGNDPANRVAVTFAPPSITLAPGQYLMIKWTDPNEAGTDGFQALDDFSAEFTEVSGLLTQTVTNVTRNLNGTPADPTDDTFGFTLKVTGSGGVGAGWTTTDAPAGNASSANYGASVVWTGFPATGPKTITVSDATSPSITTTFTVSAPPIIGTNEVVGAGTPILSDGADILGWTVDEAARTLTQNSQTAQTDFVVNSSVIDLSTTGFVSFTADLDAITGTSSGFEAADFFSLYLIIDGGAPISVLGTADTNADGKLSGAAAAGGTELPDTTLTSTTKPFSFSYIIPDTANSVQIRIIGNSNSPSETYLVKNVKLSPPPPSLVANPAGAVTVNHHGTADPSDDEFSAQMNITGVNLGGSTGWHSDEVPSRTGLYATANPVTFGPYPVSNGAKTIILTDNSNPLITTTFTLTPPPTVIYTIGQVNLGGGLTNLYSDFNTTPAPEWVNDATARTLTMNAGIATDSIVTSETLDLSAVGAVEFSADFHMVETSDGSNLEVTDRFKAELIIDGTTHNLVSAWDKGDGASSTTGTGANGAPNGYINGYSGTAGIDLTTGTDYTALGAAAEYDANKGRDEFNLLGEDVLAHMDNHFPLSFAIPASANSVQLKIYGTGISGTETATVSNVQFIAGTTGGDTDSDGDGVSDANEVIMGTNPADAKDVLRLTQNPATPTNISFPSKTGRFYKVYVSDDTDGQEATHLLKWKEAGLATLAGDGTAKQFNVTVLPTEKRRFYRLHVLQADGPWPANYP